MNLAATTATHAPPPPRPRARDGRARDGRSSGGAALLLALALAAATAAGSGCATIASGEGLDVATLPLALRADYSLFARRCSKCHSLARPLDSGIDDDHLWVNYVERMRRQPGSGISRQDAGPILRFLHYYSVEQQREKRARATAAGAARPPNV